MSRVPAGRGTWRREEDRRGSLSPGPARPKPAAKVKVPKAAHTPAAPARPAPRPPKTVKKEPLPIDEELCLARGTGTLANYVSVSGYGFIAPSENTAEVMIEKQKDLKDQQIWFRRVDVNSDGNFQNVQGLAAPAFRSAPTQFSLKEGQPVEFRLYFEKNRGKFRAHEVKGPNGKALLPNEEWLSRRANEKMEKDIQDMTMRAKRVEVRKTNRYQPYIRETKPTENMARMKTELEDSKRGRACRICMDKPAEYIHTQCLHLIACEVCCGILRHKELKDMGLHPTFVGMDQDFPVKCSLCNKRSPLRKCFI